MKFFGALWCVWLVMGQLVVTVQIQMDDKMSCFVSELHRFSLISELHSVEIS